VITPGTHTPESPKENTYIVSICPAGDRHGIAAADISTGEFLVFETTEQIADEVNRFEPKEVLVPASMKDSIYYREALSGVYLSGAEDYLFDYADAYRTLLNHFRVSSLEGFGCEGLVHAISAAGALISYLENTQKGLPVFKRLQTVRRSATMFIDSVTQRNLELTHNLRDSAREGTLISVLDETLTPMGGRFLRATMLRPLLDLPMIRKRLDAVACLCEDFELLEELRTSLRKIQDIERLSSRIASRSIPGGRRNEGPLSKTRVPPSVAGPEAGAKRPDACSTGTGPGSRKRRRRPRGPSSESSVPPVAKSPASKWMGLSTAGGAAVTASGRRSLTPSRLAHSTRRSAGGPWATRGGQAVSVNSTRETTPSGARKAWAR